MPVRRLVIESFLFYLLLRVIVRLEDDNKLVKTEYKPLMRSMAFIIPSRIRFFTPVSWAGILLMEILFFCQAIDVFGNNDVCSWKYTRYRLAISFVLIVSTTLICVMEDIRGYKKYKRNREWVKIQKPVKTEKCTRGTGNIIEQIYYDKAATDYVNGTVIILPYTHNVDPNGDFCINGQRNDIKINTRYGYVYEYDTYYENIMPYNELTDILNESGYNVIRFRFADDNKGRDIETFCMEIKDIVEKRSLKHILLLGHGAEGCIEAEILSTYISVSGMILLCGTAVGIMESIRQRESIMVKGKPWFNFRDRRWGKNYLNNLDRLPLGKECATCISKERCGGYCSKYISPYTDSLRKYTQRDLENLLKKCGKDILIVFATKAADYNEKRVNEILAWNDRRIRVVRMEGEYDTFRKPVGRDYRSYSEAYELKEGEDEAKERKLDAEFVNVLKEFLGSCQM